MGSPPAATAGGPPGRRQRDDPGAEHRMRVGRAMRLRSNPPVPRPDHRREFCMKWTKPEFELLDLCSEVTSYFHR